MLFKNLTWKLSIQTSSVELGQSVIWNAAILFYYVLQNTLNLIFLSQYICKFGKIQIIQLAITYVHTYSNGNTMDI